MRELREGAGLTREALSAASGIPFGTIHGYEIGRRAPSLAASLRLARALGTDCTAFANCTDVMGEPEPEKPAARKKGKAK